VIRTPDMATSALSHLQELRVANHLASVSICTAGALIPGLGHALKGRWGLAILFQMGVLGVVIAVCLTRLVVAPLGLEIMLALVVLVHGTSAISAVGVSPAVGSKMRRGMLSAGFLSCSLALATGLFISKASLLGVNLYYIPSASMYPTLKPGDLILVDTWAYKLNAPAINDIVVFSTADKPAYTMVKRVIDISDDNHAFFLLGDNARASQDSRHFGDIHRSLIQGRAVRALALMCDERQWQ